MSTAELSVLLYVPGDYATIRRTMEHLREQTVSDRLEILLLTPLAEQVTLDEGVADEFQQVRVIEVIGAESRGQAIARTIRQAEAPLVVFAEDHAYPLPDWAEKLIEAHQSDWAGVSPALLNGNPDSIVSWSNFLIAHGRWIPPVDAGVIDELPISNGCYKRELLLQCGDRLASMLEREGYLHQHLRSKGHEFFLEPAAKVHHFNVSRLTPYMIFRFHSGRAFGASRANREEWSPLRRMLYLAGSPLIPLMYLRPILGYVRRCNREHKLLPRVLPALMLGVIMHTIGEATGYLLGMGKSRRRILAFETNLDRNLTQRDREIKAGYANPVYQ